MLSIVATLKEFWSMLLGANTHVFTDHKTWRSILSKHNMYYAGVQKSKSFNNATLHWGPQQYSCQQPFKAPLPNYTGSDCGGEKTCRVRIGFYWGRRRSIFLGSKILFSIQWGRLGMHWVLPQLTWYSTSGWEFVKLCTHLCIAATGKITACSTSEISRQLCQLTTGWWCQWHHLL